TQVVFEENKSKEILLAEQNALKNPELVNKQVKEAQTISEKFNKLAADSLLFAQNLRTKAETAPPGQQAFLIKQAETIEARTQHNQKMALAYEQFAEDLKRVQKSAEVRSQM